MIPVNNVLVWSDRNSLVASMPFNNEDKIIIKHYPGSLMRAASSGVGANFTGRNRPDSQILQEALEGVY